MGALPKKKELVEQLKADLKDLSIALILDYRGLSVSEITEIRKELYKSNTRLTVAKNSLVRRAIENSDLQVIDELLKGPTAIAVGRDDQVAPVKALKEYLKKNKKTNEIRGGYMEGKMLSASQVLELADMPSIDELRSKLVGGIASPLRGIVASISGPQRALANVLDQLASKKQQENS